MASSYHLVAFIIFTCDIFIEVFLLREDAFYGRAKHLMLIYDSAPLVHFLQDV